MTRDPLFKAAALRDAAAEIICHCKTQGGGHAWLRDEPYYENAGKMLVERGFGRLERATVAGRGNIFYLEDRA